MASEQCGLNHRWSIKGMTALVSGGTRGIGAAIVEELAGFGAEVHTCSRNQKELDQKVQEWQAKGFKVSGSVCDLASREQRKHLIHTVSSLFNGKLNILVNNAAICKMVKATDYEAEEFSRIIETNVESPYHLTQLAYPLLKATGNASVVFISSLAGHVALPAFSVYGSSKAAINQLTKNLACEWVKHGIRVNAVSPFTVRTTPIKPEKIDPSIAKMYGEIMMRTPLKPIAEANEIISIGSIPLSSRSCFTHHWPVGSKVIVNLQTWQVSFSAASNQRWSLKGMTALVSGGTRGIGAAIVEELAGFGAEVHTCSRNQKELDQKVQEWQAKRLQVFPEKIDPSIAKMYGEIMMRTPLKPIAEANEISPLVAFLCLPAAASHITGQVILIDGGYTAGAFHF
nr:tropinone reductase homolog At5g06060-like [Ipomoea batatas]